MPAASPLAGPHELDENDVQILADVVAVASQSPDVDTYPLRALLSSYEALYARGAIDDDRNSLYRQFLFELRPERNPDLTLQESFERRLFEHGFAIETSSAQSASAVTSSDGGAAEHDNAVPHASPAPMVPPTPRSRRASFESFYTQPNDRTGPDRRRPGSRASFSHVPEDTRPLSPGPDWPRTDRHAMHLLDASMINHAATTPHHQRANLRAASEQYGQASLQTDIERIMAGTAEVFRKYHSTTRGGEDGVARQPRQQHQHQHQPQVRIQDELARPKGRSASARQTPRSSDLLQATSGPANAPATRETQFPTYDAYDLEELELRALEYDTLTLVRKNFRILWVESLRRRELSHLDRQCQLSRRNELLFKAFDHWKECTVEQVTKTAEAKRRLDKLRCFQSWRDYTASNELKVRSLRLRKFFLLWQQRFAKVAPRKHQVVDYYEDSILHRLFAQWLWQVRERETARATDHELKRRFLEFWVTKYRSVQERETRLISALKADKLREWRDRVHTFGHQLQETDGRYQTQLVRTAWAEWQRQRRFQPLIEQSQSSFDRRVASSAFNNLVQQFRREQQAKEFDRVRLLRLTWKPWNELLRAQSLATQIDDRILTECLYRWVIAERCQLFCRLRTERLLNRCMIKVMNHWSVQSHGLSEAWAEFKRLQARRITRSKLLQWQSRARTVERHQSAAIARDERRVAADAFERLQMHHEKAKMLQESYLPNAVLWFKGKQTLQILAQAVKDQQCRKRHEAYVTMRRNLKMNLCRRVLQQWGKRTLDVQALNNFGDEAYAGKMLVFATAQFDIWRDKYQMARQMESHAVRHHGASLAHLHLGKWADAQRTRQEQATLARELDREHTRRAAYKCLRTMHFRIRRVQDWNGGAAVVADFRRWSQRRQHRNLLRLWAERTLVRRGGGPADLELPPTARARRFRNLAAIQDNPSPEKDVQLSAATPAMPPPPPLPPPPLPPPQTPSRRLGRSLRFAAGVKPEAPASASERAPALLSQTPAPLPVTDSKFGSTTSLGRSTAGVRRSLFAPIP